MPFYEFACEICKVYFEVGTEHDLDTKLVKCIECGARRLKIVTFNASLGLRIQNLTNEVRLAFERIERIEDSLDLRFNDAGPNTDKESDCDS